MKCKQNIHNAIKRYMGTLPLFMVAVMVLVMAVSVQVGWADGDGDEIPFDEAHIFFELNDTDGDLGIHALIDGEPWKRLEIEDPNERRMLKIRVNGRLRRQGLTEIFFESAEPTFDELPPEKFFRRFPEGTYEIEGITLEGDELESTVYLSHVIPAPPVVHVNVEPAAEDCDAEELPEFEVGDLIIINWAPVTTNHQELGEHGEIDIHNYEVVVEIDDSPWKTSVILPPGTTEFQVPVEILELAEFDEGEAEFKFEVLARATNYNQTAMESCFVLTK